MKDDTFRTDADMVDDGPPIDDSLREMLYPEPEELVAPPDTPPGRCPIHGNVGFDRFLLIADGRLLSDHCVKCVSRVFTAMFGVLEIPE